MAQCDPTPYEPDMATLMQTPEGEQAIIKALDSSGALGCSYTNDSGSGAACVGTFYGGGCGYVSTNSLTTQGCQSVSLMSNVVNSMTTSIKCVLNTSESTNEVDVRNNQVIRFRAGNVTGSALTFSQRASINVKMANIQSTKTQSALTQSISDSITNTAEQAQSTANEAFSNPQSQIAIQNLSTNINNYTSSQSIQETVTRTVASISSGQEIVIDVGNITNSTLDVSQEAVIDAIAKVMVDAVMTDLFQNEQIKNVQNDLAQTLKQVNAGPVALLAGGSFIGLLLLIGLGYLAYKVFFSGGLMSLSLRRR